MAQLNERLVSRSSAMRNPTMQIRTSLTRQAQTLSVIHALGWSTKEATLLGGLSWKRELDQNTSSPSRAPMVFGGWSSALGGSMRKGGWRFLKVSCRRDPVSHPVMTPFLPGLLTSCVNDVLSSTLQPIVQNTLQSIFTPSPSKSSSILLPVASHLLTGLLLSPLDLVRTRLIVQSFLPRYRSYTGPLDALLQILRNEGGLKGVYLHPHLLIPAILDNGLRPLVSLTLTPYIATSVLGLHGDIDSSPFAWAVAELVGTCVGLIIVMPFETIRRRLQVQARGFAKPIKSCVEPRPLPYNGVVDAFWHIITEERSNLPERWKGEGKEKDVVVMKESWWRGMGIEQLYRGFGMRLSASFVVFLLGVANGGFDTDSGWAEL